MINSIKIEIIKLLEIIIKILIKERKISMEIKSNGIIKIKIIIVIITGIIQIIMAAGIIQTIIIMIIGIVQIIIMTIGIVQIIIMMHGIIQIMISTITRIIKTIKLIKKFGENLIIIIIIIMISIMKIMPGEVQIILMIYGIWSKIVILKQKKMSL
jgi:hypothetical protein